MVFGPDSPPGSSASPAAASSVEMLNLWATTASRLLGLQNPYIPQKIGNFPNFPILERNPGLQHYPRPQTPKTWKHKFSTLNDILSMPSEMAPHTPMPIKKCSNGKYFFFFQKSLKDVLDYLQTQYEHRHVRFFFSPRSRVVPPLSPQHDFEFSLDVI